MSKIFDHKSILKKVRLILFLCWVCNVSCRKLVEAPIPSESIADENVYSTDATSITILNDIYTRMNEANQPFQGRQGMNIVAGLSADELTLASGLVTGPGGLAAYYSNRLSQVTGTTLSGAENWNIFYLYIFKCNAAIKGLTDSRTLTSAVRNQLLGEAKFLRAFYYFYLVNMFGDVPLALTTDPGVNEKLQRTSVTTVYQQIVRDLEDAKDLLNDNYLMGSGTFATTTERTRPTRWAAKAMLARVYLYTKDYSKSEENASEVINNTFLFGPVSSVSLNSVFLKNSKEAIWQIQPTVQYFNTQEAQTLIIPPAGINAGGTVNAPVYLNKQWLANFEPNDQRKVYGNWIDTTIYTITASPLVRDTVAFCYKYKKNEQDLTIATSGTTPGYTKMSEYFMVLRLGEQYLIRAEARAKLGNIGGAQADLNAIRNRAGLSNTMANDEGTLLAAILKERQVELFCEWGNRWFDLKRAGKLDQVMTLSTPLKSNGAVQWASYKALYPLPLSDLIINNIPNPYLTQNPGY